MIRVIRWATCDGSHSYAGFDGGLSDPEPLPASRPSTHELELRDAKAELAMVSDRLRRVEAALRAAHHVLSPHTRARR